MQWAMYYDRRSHSVDGLLTLQKIENYKPYPLFQRLKSRSGQNGFTETDWVRGKSPIPKGNHWIRTTPSLLQMEPRGTRFFPICSDKGDHRTIEGKNGQVRIDIGLHRENKFPGSAGCVVVVNAAQAEKLFDFLESIEEDYIPFYVV